MAKVRQNGIARCDFMSVVVILVIKFPREGYKIEQIFDQKSIDSEEIVVLCTCSVDLNEVLGR